MSRPDWTNEMLWLGYEEPYTLLRFLRETANERKLRLFGCACCRRLAPLFPDAASRAALDAAEGYADGLLTEEQREQAHRIAKDALGLSNEDGPPIRRAFSLIRLAVYQASKPSAGEAAEGAASYCHSARECCGESGESLAQAALVRDLVGNPFRPVTVDPSWLTSDVVALARGIYEARAFDGLPILADALQDAGCEHPDILHHCRDPRLTHVRGCWVVDLVLGKA